MVEAISTLDEPLSQAIPLPMVEIEALRLARNAVKDQIRAQNLRLKDYEHREITRLAMVWLHEHRASLIGQATITLLFARSSVRIPTGNRTLRNRQSQSVKETQS